MGCSYPVEWTGQALGFIPAGRTDFTRVQGLAQVIKNVLQTFGHWHSGSPGDAS